MAINRDIMCATFQCETFWFINIKWGDPHKWIISNQRLLYYIRRVNLDVLWSQEPSTVGNVLTYIVKVRRIIEWLGLETWKLIKYAHITYDRRTRKIPSEDTFFQFRRWRRTAVSMTANDGARWVGARNSVIDDGVTSIGNAFDRGSAGLGEITFLWELDL